MNGDQFLQGASLVTLMTMLGGAIVWAWKAMTGRLDKRQADMDEREALLDSMVDSRLEEMKGTIARLSSKVETIGDLLGRQRTAIHLLVVEIARDHPDAAVLQQVNRLLGDEFPIFLRPLPAAMTDLVRKLDEGGQEG